MSCEAQVIRGKIAKVAQHLLAKECMTEEVIDDIIGCNVDTSQIWYGLHDAIAKLSTCKLKGRIRKDKDGHFLTIPIVLEFATMISDFLGPVEEQGDEKFFPPREEAKSPSILTPFEVQNGRHLSVTGRTEGDVSVSIAGLSFENHKILLRFDILDTDIFCDDPQVVLSEFKWI